MTTMSDMVEDWVRMRTTLQRQVKMLQSGEMHTGDVVLNSSSEATIVRLKGWIAELNALLKEHVRDARP